MGTLPQSQKTSWLPQDDIQLKNAIEAGASLESLAKGAVNFSQRFTLQEVKDRWNDLLYDPVVSAEASVRMVEFQRSKENNCFYEKRKSVSVRQQYYALRKRLCNDPSDQTGTDLGSITKPGSTNAVENGQQPDLGFGDEDISMYQNNIENVIPHSFEKEKTAIVKNCSVVEEVGQVKDGGKAFPPIADQTQTGEQSGYSGFRGGTDLKLAIPSASFHSHGYSSSTLDSPLWNAIEGLSTPTLPDIDTCDGFVNVTNESEYNVELSEVMQENQMLCDDKRNSDSSPDDYLAELSESLFDFTNEEEVPLMDSDGDMIDKSYIDGFSSLLLDSPSHNGMPNITADEGDCANILDRACGAQVIGHPDGKERPSVLKPEYCNGVICCVLNTEDPDVPFNDDVFLLTGPSLSTFALPSDMPRKKYELPPVPTSSFSRDSSSLGQKVNAGDPIQKMSERNSFEQSLFAEFEQSTVENADGSDRVISFPENNGLSIVNEEKMQAEVDPTEPTIPDLAATQSPGNHDEFPTWSEDDVPCYSDVEEMILDMDLSLDGQEFYPRRSGSHQ